MAARVRRIVMPRPTKPFGTTPEISVADNSYIPKGEIGNFIAFGPWDKLEEVGKTYILFTDTEAVTKVHKCLQNRFYNTHLIHAELCPMESYTKLYSF